MNPLPTSSSALLTGDAWLAVASVLEIPELLALSTTDSFLFNLLGSKESKKIWLRRIESTYGLLQGDPETGGEKSMKEPRLLCATVLRKYGHLIGFHHVDYPKFKGGLLRVALRADGTLVGAKLEAGNSKPENQRRRPLNANPDLLVDYLEETVQESPVFLVFPPRLGNEGENQRDGDDSACTLSPVPSRLLVAPKLLCGASGIDCKDHAFEIVAGPSPFAPDAPVLRSLAPFHFPNLHGLWPHPPSTLPPEEDDEEGIVMIGSIDDAPRFVVDALSDSPFPDPDLHPTKAFHLDCPSGCFYLTLHFYHQPGTVTYEPTQVPRRVPYLPTYSRLLLASPTPLSMFPEPRILPVEGIWCGTFPDTSLYLFRYEPLDDEPASQAGTPDLLARVLDLAPPLSAPPSPRKRIRPQTPDPEPEEEEEKAYELVCYALTGDLTLPRGEPLFRTQWTAITPTLDDVELDETDEFHGALFYPATVRMGDSGYAMVEEEEGMLGVLGAEEVVLVLSQRDRIARFKRVF